MQLPLALQVHHRGDGRTSNVIRGDRQLLGSILSMKTWLKGAFAGSVVGFSISLFLIFAPDWAPPQGLSEMCVALVVMLLFSAPGAFADVFAPVTCPFSDNMLHVFEFNLAIATTLYYTAWGALLGYVWGRTRRVLLCILALIAMCAVALVGALVRT